MYPSVSLSTGTYAATYLCVDRVCVSGTLTSLWEYQWPVKAIPQLGRCKLGPLVNNYWVIWGTFLFLWLFFLSPKHPHLLLEQQVRLARLSQPTADTLRSWKLSFAVHFTPLLLHFWGIFIVPQFCWVFSVRMLESRSWQFTWEDQGYIHETCGKHETT